MGAMPSPTSFERLNLQRVLSSRASVAACVWGEAGVGKTHRVAALLRQHGLAEVRVGARITAAELVRRIPSGRPRPVWLERRVADVLAGRFGSSTELAEVVAALLALSAPLALHVEDLHSADDSSLAFWSALAGFVEHSKGIALLATARSAPPSGFQALRLEALDRAASDVLLRETLNAALPVEAEDWFWARSRGNVLFTLEYLRLATRQGWLWSDGERWRWRAPNEARPPTSLEGLLARVLDDATRSSGARALLEALAVLGDGASDALVRAVTALDEAALAAARTEAERHGVLVNAGFAHPLYREVMLGRLDAARLERIARPALECALRAGDAASLIVAVELLEPARADAALALPVLRDAARAALDGGDALGAALLEARAVEFAPPDERADLAGRAARALRTVRPAQALRLAQVAHEGARNVESAFLVAELLIASGEGSSADAVVRGLGDAAFESQWLPKLIALRVQRLDFQAVLALWRDHPSLHASAAPLLLRDVAWAMIQFGEFDAADALLQRGLEGATDDAERGALLMARAYRQLLGGALVGAERDAAHAVRLLDGAGASLDLARALEIRAEVLENQGAALEASRLSARAAAVRGELGDAWGVCRAQLRLASALLELEEYERSEELLLESRSVLERRDAREALIVWDCQLAHLYAEWQPPHGASLALRHARDAVRRARERIHPTMLNTALAQGAWIEAWHGDPQTALGWSEEALQIASDLGQAEQSGLETMARGAALEGLGRTGEAREMYERGVRQLRAAGLASAERYALELDRLAGDVGSAARRIEGFAARGQRHAINLARRYFPQLRAPPPRLHAQPGLNVQVLGALRVTRGAASVRVQSRAGKALLAILLEARIEGRGEVPDLELTDRLFPDLPERRARDHLKNLVYRLRSALEPGAITRTPTGYALGAISSDAEDFLREADLRLWRGAYLEDLDDLGGRGQTRHMLVEALRVAVEARLEDAPALAVRGTRVLVRMEPFEERALRLLLRALRASDNRRDLARAYDAARSRWLEVGVHLPESWQRFIAT
jgi:DNA-binding SARP family transcriptional activator